MKQMNKIENVFKLLCYLKLLVVLRCATYCVTELLKNCSSQFRVFINIYVAEQRNIPYFELCIFPVVPKE